MEGHQFNSSMRKEPRGHRAPIVRTSDEQRLLLKVVRRDVLVRSCRLLRRVRVVQLVRDKLETPRLRLLPYFFVNSRTLLGCTDPPLEGESAHPNARQRPQTRFGSKLYLIYADVRTFPMMHHNPKGTTSLANTQAKKRAANRPPCFL